MNRTAVALAADSIVTLVGPNGAKTFDSAEKIFELLRKQPIGVMIYNNSQFVNVPLEVIVRKFRLDNAQLEVTSLVQLWPIFEAYLLEFDHTQEDEHVHLLSLVNAEASELRLVQISWFLEEGRRKRRRGKANLSRSLLKHVAERRSLAEARPIEGYLDDKSIDEFQSKYGDIVEEVLRQSLDDYDIEPELMREFQQMIFALIKSKIPTKSYTGFVIAGFGESDLFGSLQNVELDGVYFGKFRILKKELVDIDRHEGPTAAVVPFAQTEMPQRFIFGVDQKFEKQLDHAMVALTEQLIDGLPNELSTSVKRELKQSAVASFNLALDGFKTRASTELNSVVDHLSKSELAEVAHSLVELTWLKRRYSNDAETVGGPIDVAILTKNEGFVWVRRKHYFDAALNTGYMRRVKLEGDY